MGVNEENLQVMGMDVEMIENFPLHTYDTYILPSINYGVDAVFWKL